MASDRSQLLNDAEQAQRLVLDGRQATIWTAIPGIIEAVDLEKMTVTVQPAIQGTIQEDNGSTRSVNLPLLLDVPIMFQGAGNFVLTHPIAAGDECLVVFSSRCIDAWWQSGGIGRPMEARMHDLSDGFALFGPRSQPNVIPDISTTGPQLRNKAGDVVFGISGAKFQFENSDASLKEVLTDLQSLLNAFMTTLNGFSGGGSPTTQAMLQVPAATALAALTPVLTKIGDLLE